MSVKVTVQDGPNTYQGQVATIKKTSLGENDRGLFTANLELSGDGWGVSTGSYTLDGKPEKSGLDRTSTAYGMDYIRQVLKTVGVDSWEQLVGKKVIAISEGESGWGSMNIGIANLDTGKCFIYKEHADLWKDKVA